MRIGYLLLLLPTVALAKTGTWPQLYNDGVTAYHSNDFARAATLFESATASPDHALQQRALYDLGNTSYRLGEARTPQAQQLWQRAIKSYENALALDPHDADAKFNHEFVKKKLEELKKQQQQQQNQQKQQPQDQEKQEQQKQQAQQQKESPPEQQPQPQGGQPENDEKREAA